MQVKPFRGLRPRADLAAKIASPPYDVIDSDEARQLAAGDPYTFLHVIKPEIDLDPSIALDDARVYEKARENFRSMIDNGWLARDEAPAYYVYRLTLGDHRQTGIVGAAAVEDYLSGTIKKHEHTRPEKEKDRTRHMETLSANVGPVFLTHRAVPELAAVVTGIASAEPVVDFTAPDGVRHQLWRAGHKSHGEQIEQMFAKIPASYVADGHHRAASAVSVSRRRLEAIQRPTGLEPCNFFLTVHFPADQVRILDYNRIVRDLNGLDPLDLLERIRGAGFEIRSKPRAHRPLHAETFSLYLDGKWYLLVAGPERAAAGDGVSRLDVSILADRLLGPILGIGDPRTDRRIDFVGGSRGPEELQRRVDSGDYAVAFGLFPTSLEQVMAVADAGRVMPPKSTWFEPKLRSGLVSLLLDGDTL